MESVAQGLFLVLYGLAVIVFVGSVLFAMLAIFIFTAVDIFERDDLGVGKIGWLLLALLVPLLGVAIYWISRPVYRDQPTHHFT